MTMVGVEFICPVELVSLSARRMHAWGLLSASVGKEEKPLTRLHRYPAVSKARADNYNKKHCHQNIMIGSFVWVYFYLVFLFNYCLLNLFIYIIYYGEIKLYNYIMSHLVTLNATM